VRAQVAVGATLTVLRGSVGILRPDGVAISPAANGLTLGWGDRVATLGRSSALVTFFEGAELEIGADTTVILHDLNREDERTTISIESAIGTTVSRVVTLTAPGSSYWVEAGGSVALVRGTVFGHHVDPAGDVTLGVGEGSVDFTGPGMTIRPGQKRTVTSRGDVADGRFDPSTSLLTALTEPVSSGNPSGTDNPGIGTGSSVAPQQQSQQQVNEHEGSVAPPSTPGRTFLVVAALSGTTRLEVASTDGFVISDVVRIGAGPGAELGTIAGIGSIILQRPLVGSFPAGTPVEDLGPVTPTVTATATPTATVGFAGTSVPSPTATPSPTSTRVATVTATDISTATPTASATVTVSPTHTSSPTPTAIATSTSSPTLTATPTASPKATETPTASPTSTATRTATPTTTATPSPTPSLTATPLPCAGPLVRELASRSDGTTGTTLGTTASGIRLTVYLQLSDAPTNTPYDVYVDTGGGSAGIHQFVGSFVTDALGNANFTGSIVVPTVAAAIDNEVALQADNASRHQHIRELFAPCPE
jgi:hypothetical protein